MATRQRLTETAIKTFPKVRMPRAVLALLTAPVAGILAALASWRIEIGEPLTLGVLAVGVVWLYALLRRSTTRRRASARRGRRR